MAAFFFTAFFAAFFAGAFFATDFFATDFTLKNVDGKMVSLKDYGKAKGLHLIPRAY